MVNEITSKTPAKLYDAQTGKALSITVDNKNELSVLLANSRDNENNTYALDYDYLNPSLDGTPTNKKAEENMLSKIAGLHVEKDEKGQNRENNLSKADFEAAVKSDKFEVKQEYNSASQEKGLCLTDKETKESILVPKTLSEKLSIKQNHFEPKDDLDLYKVIKNSDSGKPDTAETKKIKEKFDIKSIETNAQDKTATIKYKDNQTKDSVFPLNIKDSYIEKSEFDNEKFKNVDPKIKKALWNEMVADSKDKSYVNSKENKAVMGANSEDANKYISKIKSQIPDATPEQIAKLMKTANQKTSGFSNYSSKDEEFNLEKVKERRFDDYVDVTKNTPESVRRKGPEAVKEYRNNVLSILETSGEYGPMYIKQIPDSENMTKHADGLKRLSAASEKNQGCKFTNAALFNGFTADELEKKVVIPNEKISRGEKVGDKGDTLVMIAHEGGSDYDGSFKRQYTSTYMNSKYYSIEGNGGKFNESFLGHYENILVIQPNNQTADKTLNTAFSNIKGNLDTNAKVDMTFIAHSGGGQPFLSLPRDEYGNVTQKNMHYGERLNVTMMDNSDFGKTGQSYTKDMQQIFQKSIDNQHNPKFIGQGCTSEFMQRNFNNSMPEKTSKKVRVFGAMGCERGLPAIGFINDKDGTPRLQYGSLQDLPMLDKDGKQEYIKTKDGKLVEKTGLMVVYEKEISSEEADAAVKSGDFYVPDNNGFYSNGVANLHVSKEYNKGKTNGQILKNVDEKTPKSSSIMLKYLNLRPES